MLSKHHALQLLPFADVGLRCMYESECRFFKELFFFCYGLKVTKNQTSHFPSASRDREWISSPLNSVRYPSLNKKHALGTTSCDRTPKRTQKNGTLSREHTETHTLTYGQTYLSGWRRTRVCLCVNVFVAAVKANRRRRRRTRASTRFECAHG